ncbi:LuxR C-terminal-related transcriptional regulator [Sphaerisporangium aureirubrum]|uniref:LuxR C-terminal-related transcriptional regulator n=1 Tax=Sphaerisporangium aureirubrum TaxID=1544736 RepID=A0ABW1NMB1_9ACTN
MELTVLSLIASGHSVSEIASLLRMGPRGVESHKRHLYGKLGVGSQIHAVSRGISLGLFDLPRNVDLPPRLHPERGRPELVIVHALPGACFEVSAALLERGTAFLLAPTGDVEGDPAICWHRGPMTVLLVDPLPRDWSLPTRLHAPSVIVRSTLPSLAAVMDALRRGARGLVCATDVRRELDTVLTLVMRGYHFVMTSSYAGENLYGQVEDPPRVPELTSRERDILASIASGHTIRQTARALGITTKTVENTQARLFRKLGTRNRQETLTLAYQLGVVPGAEAGKV